MSGMSPEELRKKLEALNRGPIPEPGRCTAADASPRGLKSAARPGRRQSECSTPQLERLIDGRELQSKRGKCYRIRRRLSRCWPGRPPTGPILDKSLTQARRESFTDVAGERAAEAPKALDQGLGRCVAEGTSSLLFTDLETCGFAGTPVFLIGLMFWDAGDLCVEQLLARSYEEEPAILTEFADRLRDSRLLVSFNGKAFDWPFLCDRAAVSGVELPEPRGHCDLLHVARRRYRGQLPDCRLQTLERYICHRRRADDIPGSEIPGAYHHFVRTSDAREIRQIVHHNFLDLVTLAELLAKLVQSPGP